MGAFTTLGSSPNSCGIPADAVVDATGLRSSYLHLEPHSIHLWNKDLVTIIVLKVGLGLAGPDLLRFVIKLLNKTSLISLG